MAKWLLEGVMMDVMCGNFLMVKVIKETKGEMFFLFNDKDLLFRCVSFQ